MKKISTQRSKHKQEEEAILTFLKKTREGKFAEIDQASLEYVRISTLTEPNYDEEAYLFSFS
jgi:hypothetical protein